jgi:Ni,Fe-hydrogenase I small subunit
MKYQPFLFIKYGRENGKTFKHQMGCHAPFSFLSPCSRRRFFSFGFWPLAHRTPTRFGAIQFCATEIRDD